MSGNNDPTKITVKLTVKDIPLSFCNNEIKEMLHSLGADVSGDIKYVYIRDNEGKLKSVKNGDRFTFVCEKSIKDKPLPRKAACGPYNCRIFHKHQPGFAAEPVCRNCKQPGHWASNCTNVKVCVVCESKDRAEGSTECLWSILQLCQALQYTRAVRCGQLDVAKAIKETKNPYETKEICIQI